MATVQTISNGETGETVRVKINNNFSNVNADLAVKLPKSDVINNLTEGGTEKALSAEQGKQLKTLVDSINTSVYNSVTYEELTTLINNNLLVPNQYYLITDYRTIYKQPITNITMGRVGDPCTSLEEPLLIQAITQNKLKSEAFSELFPYDKIWYDVSNDEIKYPMVSALYSKGYIYRRIDTNNNDIPYDHKNIRFKRDTKNYYTFDDGNENDYSLQETIYNNKIDIGSFDNVFCGLSVYDNKIGKNCCKNTIALNSFESDFTNNIIGNNFQENIIGSVFSYNTIGWSFRKNTTSLDFSANEIKDNFYSNTINNYFTHNKIDSMFHHNTIGDTFYQNNIGSYFNGNTVGDYFGIWGTNVVGSNVSGNIISNNFSNNFIGNSFRNKNLTSYSELYEKSYQHNIISRSDGAFVITWLNDSNVPQYINIT